MSRAAWTRALGASAGLIAPGVALANAPFYVKRPLEYLEGFGPRAYPAVHLTWGILGISVAVILIVAGLVAIGAAEAAACTCSRPRREIAGPGGRVGPPMDLRRHGADEWKHRPFTLSSRSYGSLYFVTTGYTWPMSR